MGGCVGGALGLNLSKAEKEALYNIGDVMGGDYEDDGYPTDNAISSEEELAQTESMNAGSARQVYEFFHKS